MEHAMRAHGLIQHWACGMLAEMLAPAMATGATTDFGTTLTLSSPDSPMVQGSATDAPLASDSYIR